MSTELAPVSGVLEALVLSGDLSKMSDLQKVSYYRQFCESQSLNPLTQPFKILRLNGKEILYATKDCTDQLRKRDKIDVIEMTSEVINGVYVVRVKVKNMSGKIDMDIGAVAIEGLKGEALANAMMKATTKAKRRATLSLCGLGLLDESEIESIDAHATVVEIPDDPKKRPITTKAFSDAVGRIGNGEPEIIDKLRATFLLSPEQMNTLVKLEDANTVKA